MPCPAGSTDTYYRNNTGKRFRSIKAVLEHMIVASPAAASTKAQAAVPASLQQPSSAQGPRLQSPVFHRTSKLIIKGSMLRADAGQAGAVGPTSAGKNFGSLSAIMKPSESTDPKLEQEGAVAGSRGDGGPELPPFGQPASSSAKDASKEGDTNIAGMGLARGEVNGWMVLLTSTTAQLQEGPTSHTTSLSPMLPARTGMQLYLPQSKRHKLHAAVEYIIQQHKTCSSLFCLQVARPWRFAFHPLTPF